MVIRHPVPERCVACGGHLEPWREVVPQEPTLKDSYLLYRCQACGTASTPGTERPELYESGAYEAGSTRLSGAIDVVRKGYERQRLAFLRDAVPPGGALLDAGAGQGRFVAAAAAAGYRARGFEPSRRGVEIAAARGIDLQCASLENAAFAPSTFDAVTLSHVLEHLDDPGPALERIATWLRPGGALLISVPNIASTQAAVGGGRWLHLDVPRHRHHFTPAGLSALLSRHGFVIEREHHVLLEHNPFGMWQAWADRLTSSPAYAYNLIKRNATLNLRDLAATLVVAALAPLAMVVEVIAGLFNRGGTFVVLARKRQPSHR